MENIYDEFPEPSSISYEIYKREKEELENKLEELETKVEDLECDKHALEEDLTLYKTRNANFRRKIKSFEELVTVFLDNANNLLQSSDDTIARVYEFIHSKGWDNEYLKKNK